MPIVKRYQFFARSPLSSSNLNTNFDDIITAFNAHNHTNTGTDAPLISASGIAPGPSLNTSYLKNPYKFHAYLPANQSIPFNVFTKIQVSTEEYDTGSNYDSVTNFRFTAPVNGFYKFDATIAFAATTADIYIASLFKNGSEVKRGNQITVASTTLEIICSPPPLQLVVGDYVELYGYNGNPSAINASGGQALTYFGGYLLSAI